MSRCPKDTKTPRWCPKHRIHYPGHLQDCPECGKSPGAGEGTHKRKDCVFHPGEELVFCRKCWDGLLDDKGGLEDEVVRLKAVAKEMAALLIPKCNTDDEWRECDEHGSCEDYRRWMRVIEKKEEVN